MQSIFQIAINTITGIKYPTKDFFDENGRFVFEKEIIKEVERKVDDWTYIYLIGSFLNMLGREYVRVLPNDLDVFVKRSKSQTPKFSLKWIHAGGYIFPIHWLCYDCDPSMVYYFYDELKYCTDFYVLAKRH